MKRVAFVAPVARTPCLLRPDPCPWAGNQTRPISISASGQRLDSKKKALPLFDITSSTVLSHRDLHRSFRRAYLPPGSGLRRGDAQAMVERRRGTWTWFRVHDGTAVNGKRNSCPLFHRRQLDDLPACRWVWVNAARYNVRKQGKGSRVHDRSALLSVTDK
jgi:hypothetical protein